MEDGPLIPHVDHLLLHALLVPALAGLELAQLDVVLWRAAALPLNGLQGCFEQAVGHFIPGVDVIN